MEETKQEPKRNYTVERYLDLSAKRGNVYKYPIKIDDVPKMPRFSDSKFRYYIVEESYPYWRKDETVDEKYKYKFHIRSYEKIWKYICDELFGEMEDNLDGVTLPDQLGVLYIGTPPQKDYFVLIDKPDYKHIVWRNGTKYCNRDLRYYWFSTYHKRYRSACAREDYYKTARERIPRFKLR